MRELLAAVQHIHERGYVHRDLKVRKAEKRTPGPITM